MSIGKLFLRLEKKFSWGIFGIALAILMFIYTEFLKETSPKVEIEIVGISQILDIREDVENLKIFYGEQDIKSLKKTLSIVDLNLKNTGSQAILNDYFDKSYPLKIKIENGDIIKINEEIESTNYFQENTKKIVAKDGRLIFPAMIINPGDSIDLKVLVLHNEGSKLGFKIFGKIANVKQIKLIDLREDNKDDFISATFSGRASIQLARSICYPIMGFFSLIIIVLVLVLPIILISDYFTNKKRQQIVKVFISQNSKQLSLKEQEIMNLYKSNGLSPLVDLKKILSNKELLTQTLKISEKEIEEKIRNFERDRHMYMTTMTGLKETEFDKDIFAMSAAKNFLDKFNITEPGNEIIKFIEEFENFVRIKEL